MILKRPIFLVSLVLAILFSALVGILIGALGNNFALKIIIGILGLFVFFLFVPRMPSLLIIGILLLIYSFGSLPLVNLVNIGSTNIRLWEFLAILAWGFAVLRLDNKERLNRSDFDWPILSIIIALCLVTIQNLLFGRYSFSILALLFLHNVVAGWGLFFLVRYLIKISDIKKFLWLYILIGLLISLGTILIELTRSSFLMELLYPYLATTVSYGNYATATMARVTSVEGVGTVLATLVLTTVLFFFSKRKIEKFAAFGVMIVCLLHNMLSGGRMLVVISVIVFVLTLIISSWH